MGPTGGHRLLAVDCLPCWCKLAAGEGAQGMGSLLQATRQEGMEEAGERRRGMVKTPHVSVNKCNVSKVT